MQTTDCRPQTVNQSQWVAVRLELWVEIQSVVVWLLVEVAAFIIHQYSVYLYLHVWPLVSYLPFEVLLWDLITSLIIES
jgi:hypothetical protein